MPEYKLRNIDPQLWSRFINRAGSNGWPTKALFVELMKGYADGRITIGAPPPRSLPEWAWLRAYYRALSKRETFRRLEPLGQWSALTEAILDSPAGMSYRVLEDVPVTTRVEIIRWLQQTSDLPIPHDLTLRAIAHIGSGPNLEHGRRAIQYRVLGLPPGQDALIADYDGGWRVLYIAPNVKEGWSGPHATKEDALETVAQMLTMERDSTP